MGLLKSWLGKMGPFYHNSEETYPDGSAMRSGRFEGQVRIDGAPSADTDAVRLLELNAAIASLTKAVAVADISSPVEASAYAGSRSLPYLLAYQIDAEGNDKQTLYAWVENYGSGAASPYILAGSSGFWLAVAGQYTLAGSIIASSIGASTALTSKTAAAIEGTTTAAASGIYGVSMTGKGAAGAFMAVNGPAVEKRALSASSYKQEYLKKLSTEMSGAAAVSFSKADFGLGVEGVLIKARIVAVETAHVNGASSAGDVTVIEASAAFQYPADDLVQVGETASEVTFGDLTPTTTIVTDGDDIILTVGADYNEYDWTLDIELIFV